MTVVMRVIRLVVRVVWALGGGGVRQAVNRRSRTPVRRRVLVMRSHFPVRSDSLNILRKHPSGGWGQVVGLGGGSSK